MSGLHIHISNRMEILAQALARIVRIPSPSALTPEIIIVQSRGMERWVSMALAELNGICAAAYFPFPNAFLEDLFKKMRPDLPEISPFDPEIMTFRLMRIIPRQLNQTGFDHLKTYLADDDSGLKLFQLSSRIANLFDQYLVFRPQLIFQWEAKKEEKKQPQLWQAKLWRELAKGKEHLHRARMRENLLEGLKHPDFDPANLPQRVSIFGISYLSPFHLQAFAALTEFLEIHFFLIDPCREYWADIVSERELKKMRRGSPRVAENIEWYHFEKGNRLLAAMGALGRDFFEMVADLDGEIHEQFEDPGELSVLTGIQSDILHLKDREVSPAEAPAKAASAESPMFESHPQPLTMLSGDTSIQVHSCHSPMREIEVLHDNLLAMFEDDSDLMPKDIIVMTPDMDTYAPYVQAVFAAQIDDALRIPFSIADQSPRRESRIVEGFLALLDLSGSRFGAAQVVGFLEFPAIKEKFGLVDSDLNVIERWIKDTGIRWGIDKNSRLRAGLPGYSENTWRAGLERLLLGFAMPGENRHLFNGILPYDNIEGAEVQILGKLLEFIDRLFEWVEILDRPKKLHEWQTALLTLLENFFMPDENTERDLQYLRNMLADLSDKETLAGFNHNIGPAVIGCYLKSLLEQKNYGANFLTGGITFCAMLPMRSIPFKVICLIGMNNDAFPREYQSLNFDLIAKYPKIGDRSRRNDDKYLFLESIISARHKLYISYVGQSIQDNTLIPPSVLVSELLDNIENSFTAPGKDILERIVTIHRLQPFSSAYFKGDSGLFSYSLENMLACDGAGEKRVARPFISQALPMTAEEEQTWQTLDLDSLCLFFSHPTKFFLQRRLGIVLEDVVPLSDERETFNLNPLERYLIGQNLLKSRLSGVTPADFEPVQKAMGQLPHGSVGDYHYQEMSIEVEKFLEKIEGFIGAVPKKPIEVDFEIADFHIRGRISEVSEAGRVQLRYARLRAKDLLTSWIYHLICCHAGPADYQGTGFLICKDAAVQFDRVTDCGPILQDLLELFHQGLVLPIRFFPNSSYEYAEHLLNKAASELAALNKAKRKWLGSQFSDYATGESNDPYYDLCFRQSEPLDEVFEDIAVRVFSPLLAYSREIVL
jgi:exodeoxyribonuclease V gamma subunit